MWTLKTIESCDAPVPDAKVGNWYRYEIVSSTGLSPISGYSNKKKADLKACLTKKLKKLNETSVPPFRFSAKKKGKKLIEQTQEQSK